MMRATWHTRTTPTDLDPWGMDPDGPDDPQTLEVYVLAENPDGTVRIGYRSETWDGVPEGEEPGQVSAPSGLTRRRERQALQQLLDLLPNAGPQTKLAARAILAGLRGTNRRQVEGDLRQVIASVPDDATRALAVLALGFVMSGPNQVRRRDRSPGDGTP
jgi:hypothetical protein